MYGYKEYEPSDRQLLLDLTDPEHIEYLKHHGGISSNPLLTLNHTADREWTVQLDQNTKVDVRGIATREYAWAIPDDDAIYVCSKASPIVEMGAGKGYWAELLRRNGVKVDAFDGFEDGGFGYKQADTWGTVWSGGPEELLHYDPSWSMLLVWPPYRDTFGTECVMAYQGEHVILVGEDSWGCTGDAMLHTVLKHAWRMTERVHIPSWDGISDYLRVFERTVPREEMFDYINDLIENDDGDTFEFEKSYKLRKNPDDKRNRLVGRRSL